MRWPWQRKEPDFAAGTPDETAPAASSPAPHRGQAEPAPSPSGWAFLPPLQRTVGELGTTTALHRFPDQLPSRTNPSFTGTMSHLVSAVAPPGVIDLDGPDASSAPDAPGSAGHSVELPLLPPPAPRSTRQDRPVQRLTSTTWAAEPSLTTVPDGNYGVLQVPVVPEPTESPADPETAGATPANAGADSESTADGPPADLPSPAMPPAASPVEGAALGTTSIGSPAAGSSAPSTVPDGGLRPGSAGPPPAPAGAALPLQRQVPETLGSPVESTAGHGFDGSSFDGTATSVPLPVRPALQRSSGNASTSSLPVPAPSPPSLPASRPSSSSARRLGLGRPWPDPVRIQAAAAEEDASPRVQRAPEFLEPPTAGPTASPVDETPPALQPPADRTGASSSADAVPEPAPLLVDNGTHVVAEPVPVPDPASVAGTPAGHSGPGPSQQSDGSPPPAVAFTEPVVSRSAPDGLGPDSGSTSVTSRGRPTVPTDAAGAPFADPPLFAGRQSPDPCRAEPLPVVSRVADGAAPGATDRVLGAQSLGRTGPREQGRALDSAPTETSSPEVSSTPVSSPVSAPTHDTVQRAGESAPGTAGTVESATPVEDAAQNGHQPAGTEGPPPSEAAAPANAAAGALAFSTSPGLPATDPAGGPQELRTTSALFPGDHFPGSGRPVDLPVVPRSATDASPGGPGARAGTDPGTDPGSGPDAPSADTVSDASGPDLPRSEPTTDAPHATSSSSGAEPVASRTPAPEPGSSASPPRGPLTAASTAARSADAGRPGSVHGVGVSSGTAPPSSAAPPLQRAEESLSRPARVLGLRPPLSLPVVSRSVGDVPEPPAPGRSRTVERPSARSAASTRATSLAQPSVTAARSWTTAAAPPLPPVARSAGTGLLPAQGPAEACPPDAGPGGAVPGAEDGPDTDLSGDLPVLSTTASPATVPGGGPGWSSSASGTSSAPDGSLQRSPAGPASPAVRTGAQPAVRRTGTVGRAAAEATVPVAMRLAPPAPQPSGPAGGTSAGPGAGPPAEPVAVQRADEDGPAASGAAPVPPGPTTAPPSPPPADEGMTQEQVDELAKRLVGPIVRRIKADMLLDRERRGLRIDAS